MFLILGPSDSDEVLYHWLPLVLRHLGSDWNSTRDFLESLAYRLQIMGLLSLHETIPYKSLSLSLYIYIYICIYICIYVYIHIFIYIILFLQITLLYPVILQLISTQFLSLSHYTVFKLEQNIFCFVNIQSF